MNRYHYEEEIDYRFGPRLWDATPGVCCAAYQLGACNHTEGGHDPVDHTHSCRGCGGDVACYEPSDLCNDYPGDCDDCLLDAVEAERAGTADPF